MLCSSLCPALLLSRRLLPGVSSYIAAEKKKVSGRLMAVNCIAYLSLHAGKKQRKIQTFSPLLTLRQSRCARVFCWPYQKSVYPPCLAADSLSRGNWISPGRLDSQSLFPFPSPLRIVLRSIVKQEAYCHDLFPSTSFDVRVLKKRCFLNRV